MCAITWNYNCTMLWKNGQTDFSCNNSTNNMSCLSYQFVDNMEYQMFNCSNKSINESNNMTLKCENNHYNYWTNRICKFNNETYYFKIYYSKFNNKIFFVIFFSAIGLIVLSVLSWCVWDSCIRKDRIVFD